MKRVRFLAVGLCVVVSQAAMASGSINGSMNNFPLRTLPVLINVDSTGKVVSASPAAELPPPVQRILLTNLDEMVTGPAHWKGKAVSSQCIINVALKATERPDGKFDAGFAYVSSQPVPIGRWHWVNVDGRRLMLASDDSPRPFFPDRGGFDRGSRFSAPPTMQSAPPPMPAMSPPAAAPSAAPARGR